MSIENDIQQGALQEQLQALTALMSSPGVREAAENSLTLEQRCAIDALMFELSSVGNSKCAF